MTAQQITEEQRTILHSINGTTGDHYGLARYCEEKGFVVEGDQDDMALSYICISDPSESNNFWDVVVGEQLALYTTGKLSPQATGADHGTR